jgi:hypothetical protein
MYVIKKNIVLLLTLMFIIGCSMSERDPFIVNADTIPYDGIILRNWHVLGPFPNDGEDNFLDKDNLSCFGLSESTITYNDFMKLTSKDIKKKVKLNDRFGNRKITTDNFLVDFGQIFGYYEYKNTISGNAYAACIIKSDENKTVYLDFTSDDGAEIWLNHKKILHIEKAEPIYDYENFISLKLKRGKNFLLVKVYNGMYYWQMYAKLENDTTKGLERHKKLLKFLNNNKFFNSSIIDTTNRIIFSKKLPKERYPLLIFNNKNQPVFNSIVDLKDKPYIDISTYKEGIYHAKLLLNNDSVEQTIYKGDIIAAAKNIFKELPNHLPSDKIKRFVNIIKMRFNHLLLPENRGTSITDKENWQRKIIMLYEDLDSILNRIKDGNNTLKGLPGTHIESFISEIDKKEQYYIVHVPKTYTDKDTLPLVCYMPVKIQIHRPYLKSMLVANLQIIENLQDMSDEFNVIVLEPFLREVGKPNFNSIDETDFFEALNSVKENYNIDTTKIFLTGDCQGAYKALKFAVRYPDLFSGLGVVSGAFGYNPSSKLWGVQNEPLNYLNNIRNIPILVIHSALDTHTPVQNSDDFVKKAHDAGIKNIIYKRLPDVIDLFYWYEYSDTVFNFFRKIKPDKYPLSVSFSTNRLRYNHAYWVKDLKFNPMTVSRIDANVDKQNNSFRIKSSNLFGYTLCINNLKLDLKKPVEVIENSKIVYNKIPRGNYIFIDNKINPSKDKMHKNSLIEGPFTNLFTHNFIIVYGTSGNPHENSMIKKIGDSLRSAWEYKYYNDCQAKYDYEITQKDIANSNLLLIGNYNSNRILHRLKNKLPLIISADSISIGGKTVKGKKLGCYMIFPNPLNNKKYVGVIGYNNSSSILLGEVDMEYESYISMERSYGTGNYFEITCYGWYDYKIWDNSNDSRELLNGYFNYYWK